MKLVLATHSSREFFEARSELNFLENRFPPDRLHQLPPFESLPSFDAEVQLTGVLTLWRIDMSEEERECSFSLIWSYDPGYKIQSATFCDDHLVILGADRIVVLGSDLEEQATIIDPWLVGGHMIFTDDESKNCKDVWVNSSPANAVLRVSITDRCVKERIKVPDIFGKGYDLTTDNDLHNNYIATDLQPTHINCAVPTRRGLLITLWIQGVVGFLKPDGTFRELISGLRGCHGARYLTDSDEVMVTDSAAGLIWFLNAETGAIVRRLKIATQWLHDTCIYDQNTLLASCTDLNRIALLSREDGRILARVDCEAFGRSTMFVSVKDLPSSWEATFSPNATDSPGRSFKDDFVLGEKNYADDFVNSPLFKNLSEETGLSLGVSFVGEQGENTIGLGETFILPRGRYFFAAEVKCESGALNLGLGDEYMSNWLSQLSFDVVQKRKQQTFTLDSPKRVRLALSGMRQDKVRSINANICNIQLQAIRELKTCGVTAQVNEVDFEPDQKELEFAPKRSQKNLFSNISLKPVYEEMRTSLILSSNEARQLEYLAQGAPLSVPPGLYEFGADFSSPVGQISFGLLDYRTKNWYKQFILDREAETFRTTFDVEQTVTLEPIISAHNLNSPSINKVTLYGLNLTRLNGDSAGESQEQANSQRDEKQEIGNVLFDTQTCDDENHILPKEHKALVSEGGSIALERRWPWNRAIGGSNILFRLEVPSAVRQGYLLKSSALTLQAGRYYLKLHMEAWSGSIGFGLLDIDADRFIASMPLTGPIIHLEQDIFLEKDFTLMAIVSANNLFEPTTFDIKIFEMALFHDSI